MESTGEILKVKEKKVELIELFYDLIYVYAISKMTILIEEPKGGVLTWDMFGVYIVSSLIIIQAWLYMTTYVNRYATWRWYEYVLVVINMAAAILMSNTLAESWIDASEEFILSMLIMITCVAILYVIQIRIEKQDVTAAKNSLKILSIILMIYIVATVVNVMGYKEESLFINVLAIVLGAILPMFIRSEYDPSVISFPHMIERFELLTIITFGEGIVGITRFFTLDGISPIPGLVFFTIIFMFGSYVAQIHYLCNHHQNVGSVKRLMFSHYLIILSINVATAAFILFDNPEGDHLFTATLMFVSIAVFYLFLYANSPYYHIEFPYGYKDLLPCFAIIGIGALITFGFMDSPYGFLIGAMVATGGNFYLLWHKYSHNRCVNVIHEVH